MKVAFVSSGRGQYGKSMFVRIKNKSTAPLLFFIGLGSMLQVRIGGMIGLSEFVMCLAAPLLFISKYHIFKREKVLLPIYLSLLWFIGAIAGDFHNHIPLIVAVKGWAAPWVTFSCLVCLYYLLRKDFESLKWFLLGFALSMVISVFIFQRGGVRDGDDSLDRMQQLVDYKLFWIDQIRTWITLPIRGWFKAVPTVLGVAMSSVVAISSLLVGGRSLFAASGFSTFLLFCGGKSRQSIIKIRHYFLFVIIALLIAGKGMSTLYKHAVMEGWLGEGETIKYESQTKSGDGVIALLASGREETFIGIFAALKSPFWGLGTHAIDVYGIRRDFYAKYGNPDDLAKITAVENLFGPMRLPAHSHIVNSWMWNGIFGGIFWLYVLFLELHALYKYLSVYPNWFGYLAITIPIEVWNVCFSPYGNRPERCMLVVVCLLLQNIYKKRLEYPTFVSPHFYIGTGLRGRF